MRKFYSLLIALLTVCGLAQAQVTFDFSGEKAYELFGMTGFSSNDATDGDFTETLSTTSGDVTVSVSPSEAKNANRMWSGSLRMYGGTLTISSKGEKITSIVFVLNSSKWGENNSADSGTLEKGKWTGEAATVVISIAGNTQIKSMTVNFGDTPTPDPEPTIDWTSSAEAPMTVATVLERAAQLNPGTNSQKDVYVKGKISTIKYTFDEVHGTATFYISDDGEAKNEFLCYGSYYLNNRGWLEGDDQIQVGDEVIICGLVTKYHDADNEVDILETVSKKNYIYSLNGKTQGEDPKPYDAEGEGTLEKPYTITDALNLGKVKENGEKGWVHGFIVGYVNGQTYSTGCIFSAEAPEGGDKEGNPQEVSNTNILLAASADVTDPAQCIPVQLSTKMNMREALSLKDVPANLGKEVWINGELVKYFTVPGLKNVQDWSFDGQEGTRVLDLQDGAADAVIYNLNGQRVQHTAKAGIYVVNGHKMVVK